MCVCVCASLSVCPVRALTFESLDLETSFLVRRYIFRISRPSSYVNWRPPCNNHGAAHRVVFARKSSLELHPQQVVGCSLYVKIVITQITTKNGSMALWYLYFIYLKEFSQYLYSLWRYNALNSVLGSLCKLNVLCLHRLYVCVKLGARFAV